MLEAARRARAAGARVLLNLSPYGPVPDELLSLTNILLINEHEAADLLELTAGSGARGGRQVHACGAHRARDPAVPWSPLVPPGASCSTGRLATAPTRFPCRHRGSPRSTRRAAVTRSWDRLALRLAAGDHLAVAAGYAATVGSFAATSAGAQASYPTPAELAEFTASHA